MCALVVCLVGFLPAGQLGPLVHVGSLTAELREPARISVAADGTVLVADSFYDHVARFNSAGDPLLPAWPVAEGPVGVAAHPDGRYFVSLRDQPQVAVYDAGFNRLGYLGEGNPLVTLVKPTDVEIDSGTGRIYVVDSGADRIYGFESDGSLALIMGIRGTLPGQFRYPSSLAIDETAGRLLIGDHDNFRVAVFNTAGVYQFRFGYRIKYTGGGDEGWMPRTQGLAVDATGRIYVADALMGTVRIFSSAGQELGKVIEYGSDPGDLRVPCDLTLSNDGAKLYVVSTNTSRVEVYSTPALRGAVGLAFGDPKEPRPSGRAVLPSLAGLTPPANAARPEGRGSLVGSNTSAFDFLWGTSSFSAGSLLSPGGGGPSFWNPADIPAPVSRDGDHGRPRSTWDGPHIIEAPDTCARCHGITGQPGGHVGLLEGQVVLCMSCHSAGGQALAKTIHERDVADPFGTNPSVADQRGRSHAWGVVAVNPAADSVGPTPGGAMAAYLDASGLIKCSTCHDQHSSAVAAPYLRVSNVGDSMCKECHAPRNEGLGQRGTHPVGFDYPGGQGEFPSDGGVAPLYIKDGNVECMTCHAPHEADSGGANGGEGDGVLLRVANDESLCQTCHAQHAVHSPGGSWQPTCQDCHDAHDPASENLSLVGRIVRNQTLGQDKAVVFTARSGPNSFDDGDPLANDGICQVCHTATAYHKHDGSGASHNDGTTCTDCHPHSAGFMPTGGSCTDCHASPQDNGDNVPPGGRRAVVGEFPADNAHAHYGAALGGDACAVCHSQATHMDGYVDLIDPDDSSTYRFVSPEDLTGDPDVSSFCSHCHDANGAARLADPFNPFGNGNAPPDVAGKFQGTLQWNEWYGDFCFGEDGTLRGSNSHHDIGDADQAFSGAKLECLNCHGAHSAASSQSLIDPYQPTTVWTGSGNSFCLACHAGGIGPASPGFPPSAVGPAVPLRGIDSCEYDDTPWWVEYTWTHSAHGLDSKRAWAGYSGGPSYEMNCTACHDPHGSYTATNTAGNPYMIRDFVDGTAYVDDGYRYSYWAGPPWDTYGTAREVVVPVNGLSVGWGGNEGLCAACHPTWLATYDWDWWHADCTGCQSCHNHGATWGEYDWESGSNDTPCPPNPVPGSPKPPVHDRKVFPTITGPIDWPPPTEAERR